ncbi:hypothetical protein PFICI_03942 [Pestalotiopsis fici W106-1]|uniref:Uncharacterized protein n=1 Tax=Pestalotiopsis fici (strain W106-1 / CGMCC3.15140) TaxID=1229662 RepID=W3XKC7_PESFW|nr:uncharacterized protein PFICI_03942 [Pestalotiopsis fici W106-1]ETS85917.1 hypothetical protein PFICI_03942 [Pestalotiopsis fici W106-1]
MFRLGIEKVESVDSAHWSEVPTQPKTLAEGMVEVQVHAAGVNYKDVVVTMELVPGDERMLGGEAAGVVTNISPEVSDLKIGDRVVVHARALPIVYMTTIHSLFNLSNIHARSRVLVHSATGGVGIAAVQLATYAGAEACIFATVGTIEKRQFLKETFGLTEDRIFDCRSTSFAEEIMTATGGRGVDVIPNSLTGDMLEISFRTLADGGIMIELGKKDSEFTLQKFLARNSLPMEPFDRNISFRAVDMSHHANPSARLLSKLFKFIEGGHVKPINPIHPFGFDDLSSVIRFVRAGKHIGKAVLSCKSSASSKVLVRRAPPVIRLRAYGCYLIVGGLRGLCGSLAIHLARVGAANLTVISRSGYSDDKSQRVIKHINELGAKIDLLTADVTDQGQVKLAFGQTTMPIVGIIQGAMVLRDRPFDAMNITEYREATACKIEGTWNLHRAAEDLNLDLDFFTMLSSISGLVGTRGQANYAAANTFMDSFAAYRRHLGLPSCSINLGIIEDAGFLADHDGFIDKHCDQCVFHSINDPLLFKIIDLSILQQSQGSPGTMPIATPMITGVRTPQPADSLLATDARMAALFTDKTDKSMHERTADARGSVATRALMLLVKSKSAEPSDVLAAAIEAVNQGFMKILRLSETMDPDRPFGVYGIDSLAAVEIRN